MDGNGPAAGSADIDVLRARLAAWAADDAARGAAAARVRERHLRRAAEEDATLTGILLDHAERGDVVLLDLHGGHRRLGRVAAVGPDVVVVAPGAAGHEQPEAVLVPTAAVAGLTVDRAGDASGDRPPPLRVGFRLLLAAVVGDLPRVRIATTGAEPVAGALHAVGVDVVTVHLDGTPRRTVHVPLAAVAEVVVLDV